MIHISEEDLKTNNLQKLLFPELKQYIKLSQKLPTITYSEILENNLDFKDFMMVQEEKIRNNLVVEEELFIEKENLHILYSVLNEVAQIREQKRQKKLQKQNKLIKDKEKKFNKIYDKYYFPKNTRKKAYEYFVLNKKMYPKNIKKSQIENYLNDADQIETKDVIKNLKKSFIKISEERNDIIVDDFSVKKKVHIPFEELNIILTRYIEIVYLQKDEIEEIKDRHKNTRPEKLLDLYIKEREEKKIQFEKNYINKMYNFLIEHININNIGKENFTKVFKKVLTIYNKEELFYSFILKLFIELLKEDNNFSKKQKQIFNLRKNFRNKKDLEISNQKIRTPYFLYFDEHIYNEFINFINNNEVNKNSFHEFLNKLNNDIVTKKSEIAKKFLDENIKSNILELIEYSETNYDIKPIKNITKDEAFELFYPDFLKVYFSVLNIEPNNRRYEINNERLKRIFSEEREQFLLVIKSYLIQSLMKIDYKNSFPLARTYKRNIHFIIGETNSGKTYKAFNELAKAKSGSYLSPLRLLALEGQEEIEQRGHKCSMLTGEESNIVEGANFTSSTIEMLDLNDFKETIVIDEIQMIKDEQRGWAWVQALLGAPADNIILTGSEEVLPVVKELVKYTGDNLTFENLKRKSPLIINNDISDINKIKKGTAIIAFSRKKVLEFKEKLKDRKVSVIYGNLGPEVRKEEARKFRNGENEILIATDAIAMGLNLPIEQVIFSTHEKNIRGNTIEIEPQLLQQIAGRAGRYGLKNKGFVGAFNHKTLKYIKSIVNLPFKPYNDKLPVKPNINYLKTMSRILKTDKLSILLESFRDSAIFQSNLFYCTNLDKNIELAIEIDKYNFPLEESYLLSTVPLRENYDGGIDYFNKYLDAITISAYSNDYKTVYSPNIKEFGSKKYTENNNKLKDAEEVMHNLELYSWFSKKYPEIFIDIQGVEEKRKILNKFILKSLEKKVEKNK
tara:strand:- start:15138 stop:18023 length:2886 start_codon:yes stop_codon:yes gene_type:complete